MKTISLCVYLAHLIHKQHGRFVIIYFFSIATWTIILMCMERKKRREHKRKWNELNWASVATSILNGSDKEKRIYKFNASKSGIIIGTNEMYLVRATLADYSVSLRQQSYRYSSHLNKIRQIRCGKLKFYFKQFFAWYPKKGLRREQIGRDGGSGWHAVVRSLVLVGKCMLDYIFWSKRE